MRGNPGASASAEDGPAHSSRSRLRRVVQLAIKRSGSWLWTVSQRRIHARGKHFDKRGGAEHWKALGIKDKKVVAFHTQCFHNTHIDSFVIVIPQMWYCLQVVTCHSFVIALAIGQSHSVHRRCQNLADYTTYSMHTYRLSSSAPLSIRLFLHFSKLPIASCDNKLATAALESRVEESAC